jgi:tetratricopeptide (TPR) repeat protein
MTPDEIRARYEEGLAIWHSGDPSEAASVLEELAAKPEVGDEMRKDIQLNLAILWAEAGDAMNSEMSLHASGASQEEFERRCDSLGIVGVNPERDARRDFEGAVERVNQDPAGALDTFVRLMLDPHFPAGWINTLYWNAACAAAFGGDMEQAEGFARQAEPNDAAWDHWCQEHGMQRPHVPAAELTASDAISRADQAYSARDYATAAAAYAEATAAPTPSMTDADLAVYRWNEALCRAQLGQWDQADALAVAAGYGAADLRELAVAEGAPAPN